MTMLYSYFDDSSDERREKYCACGGLFAFPDHWDAFTIAWSHALRSRGVEKSFRSTDCEGGHGQFEDPVEWPKEKRDELMSALVSVIQGTELAGFASIVPVPAYKAAFPNSDSDEPFLLTIPHTIMNMAVLAERSNLGVNIWFELGGPKGFIGDTFEAIQNMKWKPSERLHALAFDSKKLYPLQAADLLAREAFKRLDGMGVRQMRKPLKRIGERVFFIYWTPDSLQYLAENGGLRNLELLAHWDEIPDAPKLAWDSLWLAKRATLKP